MNPTLLDLLLQQRRGAAGRSDEMFTGTMPATQAAFPTSQASDAFTQDAQPKLSYYDLMAPMALQDTPASTPAPFDLIGAVQGGKFLPTPGTPEARMPTPPAALMTMDRASQNVPGLASKGWNDSKLAEYYGGGTAAPWSWKPPEVPAPAAPIPGATPTFREQYYDASGALKPEYDSAKRYSHTTPGGNYVGRQYSDGTPYDPIASARQRALTDPRVQALMAERELENKGRLDIANAQQKFQAKNDLSNLRNLLIGQKVAGITDPIQAAKMAGDMQQMFRVQDAQNNTELTDAGIRVPGIRPGAPAANPLVSPTNPTTLQEQINQRVSEGSAIKAHTDRIAKLFQTPAVMNGAALVPGGAPLEPSKYNPEMANNLADILHGAQTPAEKKAVMDEVARLAIDKGALGDAMVRAAAGHASYAGLPGVGLGSFYGGDMPSKIAGKDSGLPFDLGSDTGFWGTAARLPNAILGKPEALLNLATLPGGRKVNIQTGDLYGGRNQATASSTELQQSAARKAALKQYLEAFMGQGYYK